MFEIINKKILSGDTFMMDVYAPNIANSVLPGQFLIVKMKETSERIPLTVSNFNIKEGTCTIVFKAIGKSTKEMGNFNVGDAFCDVVGPLGKASDFINLSDDERKNKHYVFIGGGVGIAPIYPQVKWLHEHNINADVIIGARTKSLLVYVDELRSVGNLYITTDDDSSDNKGLVTDMLKKLIGSGKKYDEIVAIGPIIMMKFVSKMATEYGIHCTVSLNSLMVDGTGMCGACRVSIGGQTKFTCVDGPEFDGSLVDFDQVMKRQSMYDNVVSHKLREDEEKSEGHKYHIGCISNEMHDKLKRVPILEQSPDIRSTNFDEVCLGYDAKEAILEAQRCLHCKKPKCVQGCPVSIDIPSFIQKVAAGNFEEAAKIIYKDSAFPAVCGRVCPQETQCEGVCIRGVKGDAVAIGKLERFVGDWARMNNIKFEKPVTNNGHKVAIVGSGPAGLTCAKELLINGYDVTIFESLHSFGGVLAYGIPSFRLPKTTVVQYEIDNVIKLGAHFEKDVVIGKTMSLDFLMHEQKFEAVFIGSGAGLPKFMNIPGENLCGVVSANEFLTRNNLLFSYREGYDTPNYVGKHVVVVGGGNVAMDAARTALRLGAQVEIIYRRSETELPARAEEVHHAKEEGIIFNVLCNPIELVGDKNGWVNEVKCIRMQLGNPDSSGRRKPIEIPGSEFTIEIDMLIMALGTSPNPLIASTTHGLKTNKDSCIITDEDTCQTTREGIFAGGDVVSGSATVILAMGAGKKAARAIDNYISNKK